ncbi:hypothetical protein NUACC26_032850 [Scytonema sp. NUACC26]
MVNITGYQITKKLHESANSIVYRLKRQDGQKVFLKSFSPIEKHVLRENVEIRGNLIF